MGSLHAKCPDCWDPLPCNCKLPCFQPTIPVQPEDRWIYLILLPMKSLQQKRKEANERALKRSKLSDTQQYRIIMERRGNSMKEMARIEKRMKKLP